MNITISGYIDKQYNKAWPPIINSIIIASHPDPKYKDNLFLGFIYKYLWENKACLVILLNNQDYIENILVTNNIISNKIDAKGIFLLQNSYGWKYLNLDKFIHKYDIQLAQIENIILQRRTEFELSTIINDNPITKLNLMSKGIYFNQKQENSYNVNNNSNEEIQIDPLFGEKNINISSFNEKFTPLNKEIQIILKKKLKLAEKVNYKEINEILDENKIITWITKHKINKIFSDLNLSIQNKYVNITRTGINISDKITENLVGQLKYFKWQYDIPIEYNTLKNILLQTHDKQQKLEIEKILSQEFILCIHSNPKYLTFTLKRLIYAWYSDQDLTENIRKIKIIINQKKCNSVILPMIIIYSRYGNDSARICTTKIADYFTLYNDIAWSYSLPSYFNKINNLLYYTNGYLYLKK